MSEEAKEETKHTKGEWKAGQTTDGETWEVFDADGDPVCGCFKVGKRNHEANAKFIVKACNNFDPMLAALKELYAATRVLDDAYGGDCTPEIVLAMERAYRVIQKSEDLR